MIIILLAFPIIVRLKRYILSAQSIITAIAVCFLKLLLRTR